MKKIAARSKRNRPRSASSIVVAAIAVAMIAGAASAARKRQTGTAASQAAAQAQKPATSAAPQTAVTPPAATAPIPIPATADETAAQELLLSDGWQIQSSAKVEADGGAISTGELTPKGWYPASVPTTVLAALVRDKVFPDPYYAKNLRLIPGTEYPIGAIFTHLDMPKDSPFRVPWWYRTEFSLPASDRGRQLALNFNGVNYRASVWLNGQKIVGSQEMAGAFRTFAFDITQAARPGAKNILAVEIFPPTPRDLALNWVDWNPTPPDKDMGIWRSVYITATGSVEIRYPHIVSALTLGAHPSAALTVTATLRNATAQPVSGVIEGTIGTVKFQRKVTLAASGTERLGFTPKDFPQLRFARPRLWWPWELGKPNLYRLTLDFRVAGSVSDRQTLQFGIRQITSKLNSYGAREFFVNGEPIFIRGGGWAPDMLLRFDPARTLAEMRYVHNLGLNTIRLEGKLIDNAFFRLADREGILVFAGWCCCSEWEEWSSWTQATQQIAAQSLTSQIRRLRNHPSLLVWLNGSDNPPPAAIEQMYLGILDLLDWPNPILSSASARTTSVSGPTGVKMTGPYNWVAPAYWWKDKTHGGAWGFNTETGPGPAPMERESLERTLPRRDLWPINDTWNFHNASGKFTTLDAFNQALDARYGNATSLGDYLRKAQLMAYEGERAMYEAYSTNRYKATGVIQWMLNNAWPSNYWHLWDYYLVPGGGYYGVKKANEPLHILYDYADAGIYASSRLRHPSGRLEAEATLYNLDLKILWRRHAALALAPDAVRRVLTVPAPANLSRTYFLDLVLRNRFGRIVSRNFYWLSTQPDAWNTAKAHYYLTPATAYADLTGLETLPAAKLYAYASERRAGSGRVVRVTLHNPTSHLAFFIRLRLARASDGLDAVPVLWSGNYVTLLPGERRTLTARVPASQFGTGTRRGFLLYVGGFNVRRFEIPVHVE